MHKRRRSSRREQLEGDTIMTTTNMGRPATVTAVEDIDVYDDDLGFGWLWFAGTMLGLAGLMRFIDAFWAFRYNGTLPQGLKDGVLGSDISTYAWVWLTVGCVLIISSFLILV